MDYEDWIEKVRKLIVDYDGGYFTAEEVFDSAVAAATEVTVPEESEEPSDS